MLLLVGVFCCLDVLVFFFFFKQKTAYEMRISDWSSDVCSSDLLTFGYGAHTCVGNRLARAEIRIAIVKLLARMRNIRLANGEASVVRDPHFFAYGPRELHLAFDRI